LQPACVPRECANVEAQRQKPWDEAAADITCRARDQYEQEGLPAPVDPDAPKTERSSEPTAAHPRAEFHERLAVTRYHER
jgi:hypothetical protein